MWPCRVTRGSLRYAVIAHTEGPKLSPLTTWSDLKQVFSYSDRGYHPEALDGEAADRRVEHLDGVGKRDPPPNALDR
jgi:hypothetical protein